MTLQLTCVIQEVTPVLHVLLIVPADSVRGVQVILTPAQVDRIVGAVAGMGWQGEGVAMMLVAIVAVHAA